MAKNHTSDYQYKRCSSSCPPGEEVVISGMSGRLPESHNIKEFYDHLFNKEEMVTDDDRRWKINHPEIPQRAAKIYDIDKYDAGFFGLHYRQADNMDAVFRIFMETAVEAIMDAGMNPKELEGTKTAIFVSASPTGVEMKELFGITVTQNYGMTGKLRSLISHRLSYYLKVKGPSAMVDTACSSSMNAFDAAFKAIRSGQCDNAIVGGTNLLLHPGSTRQFFRLGVLSSEGVCRVFDEDASGYVRGETIVCVFLQRAETARRIYGKIINTKSNSDGYKEQGITFPSHQAQTNLMTEIYEESGIAPSELSFLEAHGTGTQVGDPQEVEAIDTALARRRHQQLLVGSVKSSIGHTEMASGVCSIVKVLLAMDTGVITPNINLTRVKKGMKGFEEGRMKVVTELTELKEEEAIIGVNNFGFGGSNVHTILRRHRKAKVGRGVPEDDLPRLVCVSGRTEEAVQRLLESIMMDAEFIRLLHQIFNTNIPNHFYRGYAIVSKSGVTKTSSKFLTSQSPFHLFFGPFVNNFRVLGSYISQFPCFKIVFERIDTLLKKNNKKTITDILKNQFEQQYDLLGSLCVQIAIVDILKLLELSPTAVHADSFSKHIAAYHHNTITLEEAVSSTVKGTELDNNFNFQASFNPSIADAVIHEKIRKVTKDAIILNVSDFALNNKELLMVNGSTVMFLETLGRLYENGYTSQLHKLYPKVEYPVSRGTPMISPLIRWNHEKNWYTFKFNASERADYRQKEIKMSYLYEEHKFISGHVIDGRNLFPATEYLRLVWQTFAASRRVITDVQLVFTDCKFVRAVTMPKSGFVTFLVTIQRGSGYFEILEKNSVVVSGFVRLGVEESDLKPIEFNEDDPTDVLEHDEIYRELYLRGYNYSGLFKGIQKCSVDGSVGLIKWENNWGAFIDKMLQMIILKADSRLLFVPVGIKKISIDSLQHFEVVEQIGGENSLIPVYVYKDANIIKSGGIEISGLYAKSISRKKPRLEPVLEKYVFVPNSTLLNVSDAVRVTTQIILENSSGIHFKAVEIVDEFTQADDFLLHLVCKVLDDVPVVTPDLTVSSKKEIGDFPGVKVEDVILTSENNLILLVGTKLLQRTNLKQIMVSVSSNGFVLTREDVGFVPESTDDVEILTVYTTDKENLIMFRRRQPVLSTKFIEVSSSDFGWLPQLKEAIKSEENVVAYSKNIDSEGTLGLVNCVRREPNGNKVKCFFMMDETLEFDFRKYDSQLRKNLAVNVYKNGTWGTYRHLLLEEEPEVEREHCYANVSNRGDISSLKWFEGGLNESTPLPKEKRLVSIYYSAVNFKDIMVASGRVSVEASTASRLEHDCSIGFEFSGRDQSGRRVAGMVQNKALSSYVVADCDSLWQVPDCWSLEDAATVTTVYSTVLYSLLMIGEMKRGSSILIHSATGGIGLAALNVCLHYNCDIYVTVGTQEKRDYLKTHYPQILDSHVGNSRDTSFEEMIKTGTNGRGVDFVLNSLADDKLMASVRCLAKGGGFLEIGKFDLANDTSLNLLLLERGANYHGIMLDKLIYNSEEKRRHLYQLLFEGVEAGFVKPLPRVVFKREDVETAFRHMMTGKHIGKVLVKIRDEEEENVVVPKRMTFNVRPRFNCDVRFSYIIIGGLGGVGLELADWLVLRGARKLVLVSRGGVQNGYQKQRIGLWKSYGADIRVSTQNVTTKDGCLQLLKEASDLGPVGAIFNLAVVLKDAFFEDQTTESFLTSLAPKARATILLDQLTRKLCPQLRHFVIFSSVSCGRGNAGQTNYGMANSVMERICEKRKAEGLPALAIQWGAIGDVGLVAKMQKENKELVIGGTLQQKISSCLEILDKFLTQDNPVVSSMVVAEKDNKSRDFVSATEAVANVMGIKNLKTISLHATLPELGMDSMMGTEIIQLLEKEFEIYVTPQEIRSLTFAKLAEIEADKTTKNEESTDVKPNTDIFMQFIPYFIPNSLPIVELNNYNSDIVAILLPGVENDFTHLEPLYKIKARLLGVPYDCYDSEETIQDLATNIFSHIEQKINKDAGFILIGYSFGSDVVLELAALLEKKGYIGKIILIDGSPTYLSSAGKAQYSAVAEDFDTAIIQKILSVVVPIDAVLQQKARVSECSHFSEKIDIAVSLIPSELLKERKFNKKGAIAFYNRFKAMVSYNFTHEKIKSNVYLLKAKFPLVEDEDDYQVSKVCEKSLVMTTIDGNHMTMLSKPEIGEVIDKILSENYKS